MEWRSWSGLVSARPHQVHAPRDADDVVAAVRAAWREPTTVKMVGTGHSFTPVAAPEGMMLLPDALTGILAVDRAAMTVTARAGTRLHVLNRDLARRGLSLHNMGDVADQTLAGAISTGTHGSGGRVSGLAAQLAGLELVTGTGELLQASPVRNADVFEHARLGLGALGLLTTLTFEVEPLFWLRARERAMSWDEGTDTLLELDDRHDHVDAYWFPHTDRMLVKTNVRATADEAAPLPRWRAWLDDELVANTVFGGVNRVAGRLPGAIPALNRVSAHGLPERTYCDVGHRVFTSARRVRFHEMEYAVPRAAGPSALREARRAIEAAGVRSSFPVEIRLGPAEDVPLSTSYGRDAVHLSFHSWVGADHTAYFDAVEPVLRAHDGRPHWGKLHSLSAAELEPAYPLFDEFLALRERLDPDRIFENAYLRRVLGNEPR